MEAGHYSGPGGKSSKIWHRGPRPPLPRFALPACTRHLRSMSWQPAPEPDEEPRTCPGLETVIAPRPRDLGGFEVRRLLPAVARRSVGPFIFWDQMGPATFPPGRGIDVRPHPHIGLA